MQHFLERVESADGEEWLRRCLSMSPTERQPVQEEDVPQVEAEEQRCRPRVQAHGQSRRGSRRRSRPPVRNCEEPEQQPDAVQGESSRHGTGGGWAARKRRAGTPPFVATHSGQSGGESTVPGAVPVCAAEAGMEARGLMALDGVPAQEPYAALRCPAGVPIAGAQLPAVPPGEAQSPAIPPADAGNPPAVGESPPPWGVLYALVNTLSACFNSVAAPVSTVPASISAVSAPIPAISLHIPAISAPIPAISSPIPAISSSIPAASAVSSAIPLFSAAPGFPVGPGDSPSQPSVPPNIVSSFKSGVPEVCLKEALPCEVSPLGFHLGLAVKEKIWRGEFVDLLSLLPAFKDFTIRSERGGWEGG